MKTTKAAIPAAGLDTRMLPATKTKPREMLSVVGVQPVSRADTSIHSNRRVRHLTDKIYDVGQIVEKPGPERAFSHSAIPGRYERSPDIFALGRLSAGDTAGNFSAPTASTPYARRGV